MADALAFSHVRPELVDVYIGHVLFPLTVGPDAMATSLAPSDDEVTQNQFVLGALVCVHVRPESVEVNILPRKTTATSLVPSEDVATLCQLSVGAVLVSTSNLNLSKYRFRR